MAKKLNQINVDLNFTANANQAKQVLQQLNTSLTQISNITPTVGTELSKDLQIAKTSAQQLQQHLINAFNVKTGNLDLNKLDASLKSAGQSLGGLSTNLLKAGDSGREAFLNMQRSIGNASVQINEANGMLSQFYSTLKNTARWQISSSILHGFVGALQSAWGYAKDLDKSLNDIRIVTGYSSEKMAEFAEYANKAAKALSTTTTAYTNASLIYYQQGLSEKEILERTDITIKMANVTGKSAEEVSDQLTAIWNNFDNGSKSLEYYVDVITALGAATASSTDEISQGLEKFAAVAETVGLSYEYATAALATVTAETRQSADVVGTAFKTLFARIQGLKLGETLDDGTTLNQYSKALAAVRIDIKDTNGELKDMDVILNEMGAKWDTLGKDSQVALAQSVAGIRQYNQLISLMDNWDVFKDNLDTIASSTGALQEQADIYNESWEAAMNRVSAAAEGIYRDLFPTEELTGLADGFATFLQGVDGLVQGMGGLKGILLMISSVALKTFQKDIGAGIDSAIGKISSFSLKGLSLKNIFSGTVVSTQKLNQSLEQIRNNAGDGAKQIQLYKDNFQKSSSLASKMSYEVGKTAIETKDLNQNFKQYSANLLEVNNTQALIEKSSKYLTAEQKQQLSLLQQQALSANEQLLIAKETADVSKRKREKSLEATGDQLRDAVTRVDQRDNEDMTFASDIFATPENIAGLNEISLIWSKINGEQTQSQFLIESQGRNVSIVYDEAVNLETENQKIRKTYLDMYDANEQIKQITQDSTKTEKERRSAIAKVLLELRKQNPEAAKVLASVKSQNKEIKSMPDLISRAVKEMRNFSIATGSSENQMKQMEQASDNSRHSTEKHAQAAENLRNKMQQVTTTFKQSLNGALSIGNMLSSMASGFSTIAMGISSVTNAIETLSDEDANFATKLSAGAMAATMGLSALMTGLKGLSSVIESVNIYTEISNAVKAINIALTDEQVDLSTKEGKAKAAELIVQKLKIKEDEKEAATEAALQMLDKQDIKTTYAKVAADYANVASQAAKLWYITLIIAAIAAVIAITAILINKESEEEKQLRKTLKVQEEANEEMERTKQKAEDIKSAFDGYTSVEEKLKNCTKGTKEWNAALMELETKVFEIMQQFPELTTKYNNLFVRDEDTGALTMDTSVMESIMNDYNKQAFIGQASATIATLETKKLKNDQAMNEAIDDNIVIGQYYDRYKGNYKTTSNFGEIIKENKDAFLGVANDEEFKEIFKQIYRERGGVLQEVNSNGVVVKTLETTDTMLDQFAEMALEYSDTIKDAAEKNKQYSESIDKTNDMLVEQVIPEEEDVVKQLSSANVQLQKAQYKTAYLSLLTDNDYGDMGSDTVAKTLGIDKEIAEYGINQGSEKDNKVYEYILSELQKAGKAWEADIENAVQGTDGERYLQFIDENGEQIKKSAEWIATELASSKALSEINNSVDKANELLSKIDNNIANSGFNTNNISGQQIAFKELVANENLGNVDIGNIDSLYNAIDGSIAEDGSIKKIEGNGELTKEEVQAYLDKIIGDGKDGKISEKTAKAYGFDSIDDMVNTFYRNLSGVQESITEATKTGITGVDKLTLDSASKLTNAFKNINLGPAGEEAGKTFVDSLNEMTKGLSDEERNQALAELSTIDWTAYDAYEKAAEVMHKYGKEIDLTSAEWQDYAESQREAVLAMPDFTKVKQDLIDIQNILKDLKFGSSIKEEDYNALVAYEEKWKDFFVMQTDGTYKFIGNEKEMQDALRDTIKANQSYLADKNQALIDTIENEDTKNTINRIKGDGTQIEQELEGTGGDELFRFYKGDTSTEYLEGKGYKFKWNDIKGQHAPVITDKMGNILSLDEASNIAINNKRADMAWGLISDNSIKTVLESQGYTYQRMKDIVTQARDGDVTELNRMMDAISSYAPPNADEIRQEFEEMLASSATSLTGFDTLEKDEEFNSETQKKALIQLSSEYEACREEIEAYQEALGSGIPEEIIDKENELRQALQKAEWRKVTKEVSQYWEELKNVNDEEERAQKRKEIADSLNTVWGTSVNSVFVRNNEPLFDAWSQATGDKAAEIALQIRNQAILASTEASDIINDTTGTIKIEIEGENKILSKFDALKFYIEHNPIKIIPETGEANLDPLIEALAQAKFEAEEIGNYLLLAGYKTISFINKEGKKETLDVTSKEFAGKIQTVYHSNGSVNYGFTGVAPDDEDVSFETYSNSDPTKTADLRGKKTDIVERYKEINDQLENTNNLMNKNSTLIEGLYGEERFKKMRENIKLMEQENKQLKTKLDLANDYLAEDKAALDAAAREVGISFNIDGNGNITNYTTAMEKLHNQRESLLDGFDETVEPEEQKRLDDLDKKIEKVTSAYKQYEDTLNEKAEIEQESLDKLLQIQEEYYNLLNEEIELKISINEDDMSLIDYYLNKIADDFYQMAEAAAILFSSDSSALGISQLEIYRSNLKIQKEAIKQLELDRNTINSATGQTYINEAEYQKGLRDAKQSILDNLSSLNELDKQMLNYYGDTLAMAGEELVKYTSRMEHQSSVLEHYQSILELTGKKTNYKALGVVLESQAEASENSMRIAKESLDMYTKLADEQYAKHQQAVNNRNEAAADLYLKQYEAALEAANQAEEEYLSKAKEWGEKLKLVLENTMNDLARDLENTLTGGTSFDQMVTSMERAESLQEEYLTTTNKIYETNKLMNQVQQEIDKSTNSVAKRRMKQFIEETKQLQDQSKLSQYELDIQKAKYDLLLAEIALEEAQSTKSTVRLQRDSEGNFGYVYTADSNAISAAEQELADKQNALYNIGLEGANDYSNKYKQTMNEMYDDITEIQKQKLEGIFETEEEYQNAMAATKEYYYNKLKQYSSLYSIALTTDSAVVADAWSSDFNNMIYKTDEWEQAVNKYIDSIQISLQDYEKKMDSLANDTVGKDLDTIAEKTDNITEANDKLVDKITNPENGVLKTIEDEMKSVEDLSGKYSNLRKEIEELISEYERLIGINKDGNESSSNGIQLPTSDTNTNTNNSSNNNSNNGSNNNSSSQTSSGVKSYQTGILSWTGDGANRVWKDSSGNTYAYGSPEQKAIQRAFNKAFEDHGYSDVYMKGWRNLNADFLHKKYGLSTGGYTGDWAGSYGKLAFLHQKELVLNKDDTRNFLSSIEVIERILDTIDLHAMNSQLSGVLQSPGFIQPQETTIEQSVKIEASFPNVTNRNEIEEAFNDIINMASQYANRK